jgi:hypothetical protein
MKHFEKVGVADVLLKQNQCLVEKLLGFWQAYD